MDNVRYALEESKKLLEFYIKNIEEISDTDIISIRHYLDALDDTDCECDNYNGFYCGCTQRYQACADAKKELEKNGFNWLY